VGLEVPESCGDLEVVVDGVAASAALVRRWINTSSTRTANGRPQGRPAAGGDRWLASVHTVQIRFAVSPVRGTRFR
jgi:hypothetical protein